MSITWHVDISSFIMSHPCHPYLRRALRRGLALPVCLFAQVVRLPAVDAGGSSRRRANWCRIPIRRPRFCRSPGDDDVAPAAPPPTEPQLPPGVRNGVFQKVLFDATWLAPGGADGLGIDDLQLQSIFALPCPNAQLAAGDYARLRACIICKGRRTSICRRGCYEGYIAVPLAVAGDAHAGARSGHHARHLQRLQPGEQQGVPPDRATARPRGRGTKRRRSSSGRRISTCPTSNVSFPSAA